MTKNALFRVDASILIGGGHMMRCLTLAQRLKEDGYRISFACQAGSRETVPALEQSGFDIVTLQHPTDPDHLLGLMDCPYKLMIFDHYDLNASYESKFRHRAQKIVVIDDLADRPHDCDLLIDQTFGRNADDYSALVSTDTVILAGAQYALLRPEFAQARPKALSLRKNNKGIARVLVSLGLTDLGGITEKVLRAILPSITDASIDVVLGVNSASRCFCEDVAAKNKKISLHNNTREMYTLMTKTDLAIGAAGTTTWERCCLGLPTIVLILADNQREVSQFLDRAGALIIVNDVSQICDVIGRLLKDHDSLYNLAKAACQITDGLGTERVAEILPRLFEQKHSLDHGPVLRLAIPSDAESMWKWRNDPITRASSINNSIVQWGDHLDWLESKFDHEDTLILIAELSGLGMGVVRFDRKADGEARVSINLDPRFRSKGLGDKILSMACARAISDKFAEVFVAEIHLENTPSIRIFKRNGFEVFDRDGKLLQLKMTPNVSNA